MYVIFDIGGTNTRVAISVDGDAILHVVTSPTPKSFSECIALIVQEGKTLLNNKKPLAIAGGIAGVFNQQRTQLENTAHLSRDWINQPITEILYNEFKAPIYLENDAAVAGLGETYYGPGKGYPIVAYLTVGTGIGGARIINGMIDETAVGFEPGHQFLMLNDHPYTIEELASGSGIATQYQKEAAEIQDPQIWQKVTQLLVYGIHNTIVHWSPHIVVINGPLIHKGAISLPQIIVGLQSLLTIFPHIPEIKASQLGDKSGLYGALSLIKIKNNQL